MRARPLARSALGCALLLLIGLGTAATGPAQADPAPPAAPVIDSVDEPMWQTDGAVWALAVGHGRVFAGGDFLTTRPPGTQTGDPAQVDRKRLAAYDPVTGAVDPDFVHSVSGQVSALALSPDQTVLYAGGEFTTVDGKPRGRVAAFDLTRPGSPLLPLDLGLDGGAVRSLAATADTLWAGGSFATARGAAQPYLTAVGTDGSPRPDWRATVDGNVTALLVSPTGDRIFVGGAFDTVDGADRRALASLDLRTGEQEVLEAGLIPRCGTPGCTEHSDVKTLATDGRRVYVGAEGTGFEWFDGTLAVDPLNGAQVWRSACLGATQGLAVLGDRLYVGSHAHDCSATGGFPDVPFTGGPSTWHHLMSESLADGSQVDWYPDVDAGPTEGRTPNELGPRALATDGTSLFVGGQSTRVSGHPQQGLARFSPGPDTVGPTAPTGLVASSGGPGSVVLRFAAGHDLDDGLLQHRVYRDGRLLTTLPPVATHFWTAPQQVVRDRGARRGTHRYEVVAVDPQGLTSSPVSVDVRTATRSRDLYTSAVLGDAPSRFWRLSEPYAPLEPDDSGHGTTGTYRDVRTQGRPGPWPGRGAVEPGGGTVTTDGPATWAPTTTALELWFRTTTRTGGRLAGFSSALTGTSVAFDRHLYMDDGGQLLWGVYDGGPRVAWTPLAYNDGSWHHVVAEWGSDGLVVRVDGVASGQAPGTRPVTSAAAYTGWWRVGPDSLYAWPQEPTATSFRGDVADLAVYDRPLSAPRVQAHRVSGR